MTEIEKNYEYLKGVD